MIRTTLHGTESVSLLQGIVISIQLGVYLTPEET